MALPLTVKNLDRWHFKVRQGDYLALQKEVEKAGGKDFINDAVYDCWHMQY